MTVVEVILLTASLSITFDKGMAEIHSYLSILIAYYTPYSTKSFQDKIFEANKNLEIGALENSV